MNRQLLVFFLIACFLLCSGFQNTQIRIGVEAVNILVAVTNKKGKFVTNLSRNQFEIREEGVIQKITNFDHETNLPLFIALIIDTSSSVRLKLDFEKQAATNFIYSLMRPVDRALLAEFDTGVSLRHDVTSRPGAIANAIKRLKAGGGTALIDALYVVSREKMTSSSRRNTAVILSDGRDLNSKKTVEEALRMVHQSGVVVYSIGTTRFGANGYIRGEEMLRTLSESTGGRVFLPYSAGKLSQAFELIDEELRSRYSLTYTPINKDKDGKFRKIEVRVSNEGKVNLRYRKGYFAPSE